MTKKELIAKVYKEYPQFFYSERHVASALDAFCHIIAQECICGDDGKVLITGFGTFFKDERKERIRRDPRTLEPIKVAPSVHMKFKESRNLGEHILSDVPLEDG